jgi:hypothetical protein
MMSLYLSAPIHTLRAERERADLGSANLKPEIAPHILDFEECPQPWTIMVAQAGPKS